MKKILALVWISFLASCADTAKTASPVAKKSDDATQGSKDQASLTLSWKTLPTMSSYHVFYVDAKKKLHEIDTVLHGDEAFAAGKVIVDSSNMEVWPKAGENACFYVVANQDGVKSDPSSQACLTL